jgi:hypothetical protein
MSPSPGEIPPPGAQLEVRMSQVENTQVESVRSMTNKEMVIAILALQAQVKSLEEKLTESKKSGNKNPREMTDDDARRILTGDHAATKHQPAADALGLSYGQVYSCRKEFTFKHIHKEMKDSGKKNPWI